MVELLHSRTTFPTSCETSFTTRVAQQRGMFMHFPHKVSASIPQCLGDFTAKLPEISETLILGLIIGKLNVWLIRSSIFSSNLQKFGSFNPKVTNLSNFTDLWVILRVNSAPRPSLPRSPISHRWPRRAPGRAWRRAPAPRVCSSGLRADLALKDL